MGPEAVGHVDVSHRFRTSRVVAAVTALVVALGLVAAVGAFGLPRHSDRPVTAPNSRDVILGYDDASAARLAAPKHLRLSFRVVGAPIHPGARRTMKVTVANPFAFPVRVVQIRPTTRSTTVPGCRAGWFKPSQFVAKRLRQGLLVKARGRGVKKLSIRMVNLPTVNQDACKTARYTVALRAVARRA